MKIEKTNVLRLLDAAGILYRAIPYDVSDENYNGVEVARKVGMPPEQVFKTLVLRGDKTGILVCCIPVTEEVALKKVAAASGNKSVEMTHVKELLQLTGYVRGGCSPLGMKKNYPTYLDETAQLFDEIAVSAGQRGLQVVVSPLSLAALAHASIIDIV